MKWRFLFVIVVFFFLFLFGCGTRMVVTPQLVPIDTTDFRINGKVLYEGNREYLPRTITDEPNSNVTLSFRYTYNVAYGRHDVPDGIALFNPLSLVGCPTGTADLTIVGKLNIIKAKEVIKSYSSTCVCKKTRGLFSEGETFSEMRKRGLIEVRNNIETQMYKDMHFLKNLSIIH